MAVSDTKAPSRLRIPAATYRLQFTPAFGFAAARQLLPYLQSLGITDLYASPLLKARRESTHGYDVVDPARLNPALGSEAEFQELAAELQAREMGLLLDIVPNHMAASSQNPWWRDVLEWGQSSTFARFFDIYWQQGQPGLAGKVLLPILGAPYGTVLENGELQLVLAEDGFWIQYYDRRLPVSPRWYRAILAEPLADGADPGVPAGPGSGEATGPLAGLLQAAEWGPAPDPDQVASFRHRLWQQYQENAAVRQHLDTLLAAWNGRPGEPRSFDRLDRLLAGQAYRLAFWRVATEAVGYRRFFDVSDLVAVRVEDEAVFLATHARILELARSGTVTGLRIDHIDGLYNPLGYLHRLQESLSAPAPGGGPGFYVVVEKILGPDEDLPDGWPVHGTTGYEFLNMLAGLFVDRRGAAILEQVHDRVIGRPVDYDEMALRLQRRMTAELFAGEFRMLTQDLLELAAADRYGHDLTPGELAAALAELTACLPVYRTYIRERPVTDRDRYWIEAALARAAERRPEAAAALSFVRRVLLLEYPDWLDPAGQESWLRFVMRWQQTTGPVTAKGVEDTALYRYNRLISLNTVGGEPDAPGVAVAEFHRWNQRRQERWPHALSATSTHDTKRSEDVRCRVNVISEIPEVWADALERWRQWNAPLKPVVGDQPVPGPSMEMLIYQTLVGAWPLDPGEEPDFYERFKLYLIKAAREAKDQTSWLEPDSEYEAALMAFVDRILAEGTGNPFLADFRAFQRPVAYWGALASLAQVLIKVTAPGVPDFYQGTELWNLTLVDPDNRRPVDFARCQRLLAELDRRGETATAGLLPEMLENWQDGRVKLWVTSRALRLRRDWRQLFASGRYMPLAAVGPRWEHLCAFARHQGSQWAITAVPRLLARLMGEGSSQPPTPRPPLGAAVWGESALLLPSATPAVWRNVLTGERVAAGPAPGGGRLLPLHALWNRFPGALLMAEP